MDTGNVSDKQLEGYCRMLAAVELKEDAEIREESLKELKILIESIYTCFKFVFAL